VDVLEEAEVDLGARGEDKGDESELKTRRRTAGCKGGNTMKICQ
jgi:hypothetical protein